MCLARILATRPRLLLLDEPTRGIDVGARQEVLRIIDALARQGAAVLLFSTDTDELLRMSDRVLLFHGGRVQRELVGAHITQSALRQ